MSAPVAAKRTRLQSPERIFSSTYPASTLAEQPQPLPPERTPCRCASYMTAPQSMCLAPSATPLRRQQLREYRGAREAEVTGYDGVVNPPARGPSPEMGEQRVAGRRGHGRAHVGGVLHAHVDDAPRRDARHIGARPSGREYQRARARDRPLARGVRSAPYSRGKRNCRSAEQKCEPVRTATFCAAPASINMEPRLSASDIVEHAP